MNLQGVTTFFLLQNWIFVIMIRARMMVFALTPRMLLFATALMAGMDQLVKVMPYYYVCIILKMRDFPTERMPA